MRRLRNLTDDDWSRAVDMTTPGLRWTQEEAEWILALQVRSGESVPRFSAALGLSARRLYRWREELSLWSRGSGRASAPPVPRPGVAPEGSNRVEMPAPTAMKAVQEAKPASGGPGKTPEEAGMLYCGMDLHSKTTTLHVVDGSGRQILAKTVATEEGAIGAILREELTRMTRIFLEAGTASAWMSRLIEGHGHQAVVIDPNRNRMVSGSSKKTDKNDAALLASLGRAGLLHPVHVRKEETDRIRQVLVARRAMVDARSNLSRVIRAFYRSEGTLLAKGAPEDVAHRLTSEGVAPEHGATVLPLAHLMEEASTQIEETDRVIGEHAVEHRASMDVLKSVPGVGDVVGMAFLTHIEDANRFTRAEQVAAYLGLAPWVQESGGRRREGGITKHGSVLVRSYLVQAAWSFLRSKEDSALKQWATALMMRVGKKKGITALARKMGELLWRLLKKGERWRAFPPGCGRVPLSEATPK